MRGSSRNRTWLAWAVMFLYLLTNLSPAGSGLVLCIGQNGHIAIEVATAEADCSDCVPKEAVVEGCCTAPVDREQDLAGCTCSDIPIIATTSDVETTAPRQQGTAAVPPPCMLARADFLVPPPLPRSLDFRSRAPSPPCPRVPALLTLRI